MTKSIDMCAIGNALVDTQYCVDESIIKQLGLHTDQMTLASPEEQQHRRTILDNHYTPALTQCGGSATNTSVAASYFGLTCAQLCRVGNDVLGQTFIDSLAAAHVRTPAQSTTPSTLPTGHCLVLTTPDSKRTMSTLLGISSYLTPSCIDEPTIQDARYIYLEGYLATSPDNQQAALHANQLALKHHTKRCLSLSDPGVVHGFRTQFLDLCRHKMDIIFCNEDEALAFTNTPSLADAQVQLRTYCNAYVITRGPHGAVGHSQGETITVPGESVTAIDSNGAGDIFAGAFLSVFIQAPHALQQALVFANHAAATLVQHMGPRLNPAEYQVLRRAQRMA